MAKKHKKQKKEKTQKVIKPEFIRLKKWVMGLFIFIIIMMPAATVYAEDESSDALDTDIFNNEPSIHEIQQQAIKYAEVSPEKIERMRDAAKNKAWLPRLSVGADRNVTDLWHWEGGSTTKVDDDFLRKGRDAIEWDLTLNWDFGELVWNDDQTTIDARSRLMVCLRNNILEEVNSLYFKRRKLQLQMLSDSPQTKEDKLLNQLRLDELTANIDAFTGGYLSKEIKSRNAL